MSHLINNESNKSKKANQEKNMVQLNTSFSEKKTPISSVSFFFLIFNKNVYNFFVIFPTSSMLCMYFILFLLLYHLLQDTENVSDTENNSVSSNESLCSSSDEYTKKENINPTSESKKARKVCK